MCSNPGIEAVLRRLAALHPRVLDLALDRIERLLAALDLPQTRLPPVVHVAGTNGKGSTCAFLRAIAEAAGAAVHVYTSPHLVRFAERIRIAGRLPDDAALVALLEDCEKANGGAPITFFEITTAAALLAFSRTPAGLCLLETGLGGRFDATNVLARPALTLLTSISLDHQAYLGTTLAEIAGEKAGILKAGVPCLCVAQEPEALAVIAARAAALESPLLLQGRDWTVRETTEGLRVCFGDHGLDLPRPALPGPHQIENAGLAVAAALCLKEILPGLTAATLAQGLRTVEWPARLQRLTQGPLPALLPAGWELWLDGGHNPGAGHMLARMADGWSDRPLDLLVGMIDSKDSAGFLAPLVGKVRHLAAVTIPRDDGPLNTPAQPLAAAAVAATARAAGIAAEPADSLEAGLRQLAARSGPARVLICGSLYLAGAVLRENG